MTVFVPFNFLRIPLIFGSQLLLQTKVANSKVKIKAHCAAFCSDVYTILLGLYVHHAFQFLYIAQSGCGTFQHTRLFVNGSAWHLNIANILKEIFYLVVFSTTEVYSAIFAFCFTAKTLICYLINDQNASHNGCACLLEGNIWQHDFTCDNGIFLFVNPLIKFLVCWTSRDNGHNAASFCKVRESLSHMVNGQTSTRPKRRIHKYNIMFVYNIVAFKYCVDEFASATSCL